MKYNILNVMRGKQDTDPRGIKTRAALTSHQIADAWGVKAMEEDIVLVGEPDRKKMKITTTHYYDRNHFKMNKNWPKQSLEHFLKSNQFSMQKPNYENLQRKSDSRYQSTMTLSINEKQKSFIGGWERNKKEAEQSAALQAVLDLGLMKYSDCNLKLIDIEKNWKDEINAWSVS